VLARKAGLKLSALTEDNFHLLIAAVKWATRTLEQMSLALPPKNALA
jgi:hypothetical protein